MTKNELLRWVADNINKYVEYGDGETLMINASGFTDALWGYWVQNSERRPSHVDSDE